jgi:hypothetical protein
MKLQKRRTAFLPSSGRCSSAEVDIAKRSAPDQSAEANASSNEVDRAKAALKCEMNAA